MSKIKLTALIMAMVFSSIFGVIPAKTVDACGIRVIHPALYTRRATVSQDNGKIKAFIYGKDLDYYESSFSSDKPEELIMQTTIDMTKGLSAARETLYNLLDTECEFGTVSFENEAEETKKLSLNKRVCAFLGIDPAVSYYKVGSYKILGYNKDEIVVSSGRFEVRDPLNHTWSPADITTPYLDRIMTEEYYGDDDVRFDGETKAERLFPIEDRCTMYLTRLQNERYKNIMYPKTLYTREKIVRNGSSVKFKGKLYKNIYKSGYTEQNNMFFMTRKNGKAFFIDFNGNIVSAKVDMKKIKRNGVETAENAIK